MPRRKPEDTERMPVTKEKVKSEMEDLARYLKLFYERARALGVPAMDAEDVAHNAFLDVCNRETPLPECPNARKALLLKIVHFQVRTYITERRRMNHRAELAEQYATNIKIPYTRDDGDVIEAKEQLELVFPRISPEHLAVFGAKLVDGLTIREVAAELGINERTAQSRWERARAKLELEFERLDKPGRRGPLGLLMFVGISGILGIVTNANAMAEWLKEFFRMFGKLGTIPFRAVPGVATAAAILLSPHHPGTSADEVMGPHESAMKVPEAGAMAPIESGEPVVVVQVARVKPAKALSRVPSRHSEQQRKATAEVAPPDHLLTMAILALQRGNPEKALVILDGYTARNSVAGDASAVESLRATIRQAIAAKVAKTR